MIRQAPPLLVASAVALGILTSTASAATRGPLAPQTGHKVDAHIVEINQLAGVVKLSNGQVLNQATDRFSLPSSARIGDSVRLLPTGHDSKDRLVVR